MRRSAVALLAALIAGTGAYSALARQWISGSDTAALLLGVEAAIAVAFVVWPGQWRRRRPAAVVVAVVAFVLMIPGPIISAIAVPGCVCPGPHYPSLLGISHQIWVLLGLVGFPFLFAAAALIPSRSAPAEVPLSPEA